MRARSTSSSLGAQRMNNVGVLAEDQTDCKTIQVLISRIAPRLGVKPRAAKGCAKLRRKAAAWMAELHSAGCSAIVLVHDLDNANESVLRAELASHPAPAGIPACICIPVEELEAWFWSDSATLRKVGRGNGARA